MAFWQFFFPFLIAGAAHSFEGAAAGALFGGFFGLVAQNFSMKEKRESRSRVEFLEKLIDSLQRQIHSLELAVGRRTPPASESAAKSPEPAEPKIPVTAPFERRDERRIVPEADTPDPKLPQTERSSVPPQESADLRLAREDDPAEREKTDAWWRSDDRPEAGAPDAAERFAAAVKGFFTGGNLITRLGIVILFFGVVFLVKFAADRGILPIEARLAFAALGAAALVGGGWRLRARNFGFAVALQGGGVAILYLTVFAAFRLYELIPAGFAFALLVAVMALSAALAVGQNTLTLAVLGVSGGFLAPVLTSTGSGSHVALFSYYAVLNLGIVGMAWFRSWRPLNLLGFFFTFGIGTLWGIDKYAPEHYVSSQLFLILFFLMYVGVAVLFAARQKPRLKGLVDGTLVFGTPLVVYALQYGMVKDLSFYPAFSALAMGAFYLACCAATLKRFSGNARPLAESFFALGVAFVTAAIPLGLDARWTGALWALEGAALVWMGLRQNRALARLAGVLLVLAAAFSLREQDWGAWPPRGGLIFLNAFWFGALVRSGAALLAAVMLSKRRAALKVWEAVYAPVLLLAGWTWWYAAGLAEIDRHVVSERTAACLTFFVFSAALFETLRRKAAAEVLGWAFSLTLPAAAAVFLIYFGDSHALSLAGVAAWVFFFAVHYLGLKSRDAASLPFGAVCLHAGGFWLLTALAAFELSRRVSEALAMPDFPDMHVSQAWETAAFVVVPAVFLVLPARRPGFAFWPLTPHRRVYLGWGGLPLAAVSAALAFFVQFIDDGDVSPLPYLPFLNPLDLAVVFSLAAVLLWQRAVRAESLGFYSETVRKSTLWLLSALGFFWSNGVLLRTLSHVLGIPYDADDLFGAVEVQTALSIYWSVFSLALMVAANRKALRGAWAAGASLLGCVVLKLFFVDLSNAGTVFRIVSFIGVGLLLLAVGYFAPLPSARRGEEHGEA